MLDEIRFSEPVEVYALDSDGTFVGVHAVRKRDFSENPSYTLIEPPTLGANEVAVLDRVSGVWSIAKDYRGTVVYDTKNKTYQVVDYLGELLKSHSLNFPTDVDMNANLFN